MALEIQNLFCLFCLCKAVIIFTDGAQTQKYRNPREDERIYPGDNAEKLKEKNATIFTIGAGNPDPVELLAMATEPNNVILAELENLDRAVNRVTEQICKIEVTVRIVLLRYKGVYEGRYRRV